MDFPVPVGVTVTIRERPPSICFEIPSSSLNSPYGFSSRLHSKDPDPYFNGNEDPGGYSGIHTRSAIGGFTGRFSIEPEIIVAIPPELSEKIIKNRGWLFPVDPRFKSKLNES